MCRSTVESACTLASSRCSNVETNSYEGGLDIGSKKVRFIVDTKAHTLPPNKHCFLSSFLTVIAIFLKLSRVVSVDTIIRLNPVSSFLELLIITRSS